MPLYFVNFSDGQIEIRDDVGTDLPSPEAACAEVMRMLADTASFEAARGSEQRLAATIRDGADRVMLALTCSQLG